MSKLLILSLGLMSVLLSACGGSSDSAPSPLYGNWSTGCQVTGTDGTGMMTDYTFGVTGTLSQRNRLFANDSSCAATPTYDSVSTTQFTITDPNPAATLLKIEEPDQGGFQHLEVILKAVFTSSTQMSFSTVEASYTDQQGVRQTIRMPADSQPPTNLTRN